MLITSSIQAAIKSAVRSVSRGYSNRGYTHNIINTSEIEKLTVMWETEAFGSDKLDSNFGEV